MSKLFATLWTIAHQPSLSMGFSRHEYWSELPFIFHMAKYPHINIYHNAAARNVFIKRI